LTRAGVGVGPGGAVDTSAPGDDALEGVAVVAPESLCPRSSSEGAWRAHPTPASSEHARNVNGDIGATERAQRKNAFIGARYYPRKRACNSGVATRQTDALPNQA
jgi:hypothetical protein